MDILSGIFAAAKENPTYGLFVFATIMWWLQWKRNEVRDKEFTKLQQHTIELMAGVKGSVDTFGLLLQTLLNRRDSQ